MEQRMAEVAQQMVQPKQLLQGNKQPTQELRAQEDEIESSPVPERRCPQGKEQEIEALSCTKRAMPKGPDQPRESQHRLLHDRQG